MAKVPAVQKVGYGLLSFTWIPSRKFTQDEFNATLRKVLEHSQASVEVPLFIDGGEFYGIPDRYENISKIGGFFKTHPQFADKVYISIKGGVNAQWVPDSSPEHLNNTLDAIREHLAPLFKARVWKPKTLDMFTLSRVGQHSIEETVKHLATRQVEGVFSDLCLSEIAPQTLERALAVADIAAVEMEYSLFERYLETNGIFELAKRHNIPVVCYSPLGKGLLAGLNPTEIAKDDFRASFERFTDADTVSHNEQLVAKVREVAEKNNLSPARLAISWITTLSDRTFEGTSYPRLIPIPGSVNADRQIENQSVDELPETVLAELSSFLRTFKTSGHRYNSRLEASLDK